MATFFSDIPFTKNSRGIIALKILLNSFRSFFWNISEFLVRDGGVSRERVKGESEGKRSEERKR